MANDIKKFPVPLIFKKIAKDKMSGVLQVKNEELSKKLYFITGSLVFAKTSVKNERIGEVLVSEGKISRTQLENAIKIKKSSSTSQRMGEILVEISNLEMKDIYPALLLQAKNIAASSFSIKQGEWRFVKDETDTRDKHDFSIKLPEIIRLGVKYIDDLSFFKRKFNYYSPVTTIIPSSISKIMTPEQTGLYKKLAGFSQAPVEQVISQVKVREELFWRELIFFYLVNILDFVEFTVDEERNKNIVELNEMYERIEGKKSDYFQLFGVKPNASVEEIKRIYFDFSHKYHPDRINASPDSSTMQKANSVFAEINSAFEVLSNPEKRKEYEMQRYQNLRPEAGQEGGPKAARNLFLKANMQYKQKRYSEAAAMLDEAVKNDPSKANYFLLLGLCQSKMEGTKKDAVINFHKAADLEPWNADPIFALGEFYRSENQMKNAKECFEKALEINMEHTLASKAMNDMKQVLHGKKSMFSLFGKK